MPSHSIPPLEAQEGVPRAGDILAEKYRVERVLGGGGMGMVCAALHLDLDERVALKFLLPSVLNDETVARFSREAKAAAKIKSAHIARVTDIGCLETGSPYMVMEYLEGHNLKDLVVEHGRLPVKDAVEYVLQAIEALAEAHALGIVHRDLKPANMFLADRGGAVSIVKLIDFGISKVMPRGQSLPDDDPSMTQTSAWLGSPLYMSPEQLRSARDVDHRTDVWGLGVTLFELCAGTVPFNHTSFPDLCAMILHEPAPRLEAYLPSAPPGLGDIVARCLEKDLDARYSTVAELAIALVPYAHRRARTVAERAVAISEAAGLIPRAPGGRHPLDGTLPEEMMSPLAGEGTMRPPPPVESIPPPGGGPPQSSTTGGVSMGESSFPPAARVPMISSMPADDFSDIRPPSNPAKIVGIVAAVTVALGIVLYLTGVIHVDPADRVPAASQEAATPAEPPPGAAPADETTEEVDEETGEEVDEETGEDVAQETGEDEEEVGTPTGGADPDPAETPPVGGKTEPKAAAKSGAPSKPAAAEPPSVPSATAVAQEAAPPEPSGATPPGTEAAPPPATPDPVKSKPLNDKCYTDGPDGTKIEKPCAW